MRTGLAGRRKPQAKLILILILILMQMGNEYSMQNEDGECSDDQKPRRSGKLHWSSFENHLLCDSDKKSAKYVVFSFRFGTLHSILL